MFQTFTGSSRRPRQVNLSGRSTTNPFANTGFGGQGSPAAVVSAQQERERRQRERDRLNAAKTLQRSWRGHRSRRQLKERWRREWDDTETTAGGDETTAYPSEDGASAQLHRLLHFIDARDETDVMRFLRWWRRTRLLPSTQLNDGPWPLAYLRCQRVLLSIIDHWISSDKDPSTRSELFRTLAAITGQIAPLTARNSEHLYKTIALQVRSLGSNAAQPEPGELQTLVDILKAPLLPMFPESLRSYAAFACEFLTLQELNRPQFQERIIYPLVSHVDHRRLSSALSTVVSASNYAGYQEMTDSKSRLTLLGCFIYFHREAHRSQSNTAYASHKDFVHVISSLLSSVADDINLDEQPDEADQDEATVLSPFTHEQILSLVNQESIGNLLSGVRGIRASAKGAFGLDEEAKQLASYALTLLRFFPKRGDEIRMWLYLGSTSSSASGQRIPAIKYFWQAARSSSIFDTISRDSRAAVKLLKPQVSSRQRWQPPDSEKEKQDLVQDEWRVVLVFFELYTFVLKLMDDEEFLSGASAPGIKQDASTWAGYNALPLGEVKDLTTFLKNLGFTMYFNAAEIADNGARDTNVASLSSYFSVTTTEAPKPTVEEPKPREVNVAGLPGMSMDYAKGLVTGLLRMIYERDSRRKFLPKGHWLMTSRFDMDAFIPAVVQEEENRHKVQEEDDADVDDDEMDVYEERPHLIGTGRDQRLRQIERLQRQQRKSSRKRYLQVVAPRLEILQNMPFFIPFETRVQIFRQFVHLDQVRSFCTPTNWRKLI
jgi:ubiquitin-protein ligase E3 C